MDARRPFRPHDFPAEVPDRTRTGLGPQALAILRDVAAPRRGSR